MDHLIWICFNVFFAAFNGLYAVVNYRKAQG